MLFVKGKHHSQCTLTLGSAGKSEGKTISSVSNIRQATKQKHPPPLFTHGSTSYSFNAHYGWNFNVSSNNILSAAKSENVENTQIRQQH